MKVLISGAGMAGLTTAYWLKRYGFTPTLVERAPHLPTGGYKLDIRGKALEVLQKMGIQDAVASEATDMQSAWLIDKEGKILNTMRGDAFGHRTGEDLEIIRGKFCQILIEQIPDVECIFGDVIEHITQSGNGVEVQFKNNKNNKPRKFDLVIGADGLHSEVRQLVFGDETAFLHNLGVYLCVFTAPNNLNLDRVEVQYTELGKMMAAWTAKGEPNLKACFGFTSSHPIDLSDKKAQQQAIIENYKEFGWEVPRFIQAMPKSQDFYFDMAAQTHMDSWSQGRVALVGDAAYCASPLSGQGNSLALIGAYVLAGELAEAKGDWQKAFVQYERQMRPFININQALGIRSANLMKSKERKSLFAWIFRSLMQIAPGQLSKFIIHRATDRIRKAANAIHLKNYQRDGGI